MKILIIGNANSYWIKEYVEHILFKISNAEIVILSSAFHKKDYQQFYELNNVKVLDTSKGKFKHIPKFRTVFNLIYFAKKEAKFGKFDFVHVHYIPQNVLSYFYSLISKKYSNSLICTYWGSDLLTGNEKSLKKGKSLLDNAEIITYATDDMKKRFHEVFGEIYDNKIRQIQFGVSIYDHISNNNMSNRECKKWFNFNTEKYLIAIGYNGSKRQQHLAVIDSLNLLDDNIKNRVYILIHIGYGLDSNDYLEEIKCSLEHLGCEYKILRDFLDNRESSILRKATDVFINAQVTDAFSASIQECIFAGATLINPRWIKYDELDRIGIKYFEYEQITEISNILAKIINKNEHLNNEEVLREMQNKYSWRGVNREWLSIYTGK